MVLQKLPVAAVELPAVQAAGGVRLPSGPAKPVVTLRPDAGVTAVPVNRSASDATHDRRVLRTIRSNCASISSGSARRPDPHFVQMTYGEPAGFQYSNAM